MWGSGAHARMREQAFGWKHSPENMLLDPDLDTVIHPASQFCHDWLHAFFIRGAFNITMYLTMRDIKKDGMADIYSKLFECVGLWTLPRGIANAGTLQKLFAKPRETANDKAKAFKCQASEALSLLPILYYYIAKVPLRAGVAVASCTAFIRMVDLVNCIQAAASGNATYAALRDRVDRFLDACVAANWEQFMTPKYHWLVHFPRHFQRWGCLLSCFVHERKHKAVKRFVNDVLQLASSEWSVLSEVTCLHLAHLRSTDAFNFSPHLCKPVHAAPKKMHAYLEEQLGMRLGMQSTETAQAARVSSLATCRRKDVVLFRDGNGQRGVAEVWFHAAVHGDLVSLLSVWSIIGSDDRLGALQLEYCDTEVHLVPTEDIIAPLVGLLAFECSSLLACTHPNKHAHSVCEIALPMGTCILFAGTSKTLPGVQALWRWYRRDLASNVQMSSHSFFHDSRACTCAS